MAFGSNLGDREEFIRKALGALGRQIQHINLSSLYETAPLYVIDQPPYLNGVLLGRTNLGPLRLVQFLKTIEAEVGRRPTVVNGPREIDLDLIFFGSVSLASNGTPAVLVPHPRMDERRFVLEPLLEVSAVTDPRRAGWMTSIEKLRDQKCEYVGRLGGYG